VPVALEKDVVPTYPKKWTCHQPLAPYVLTTPSAIPSEQDGTTEVVSASSVTLTRNVKVSLTPSKSPCRSFAYWEQVASGCPSARQPFSPSETDSPL